MNKKQLINEISVRTHIPKSKVEPVIDTYIHIIKENVRDNERTCIMGFGSFTQKIKNARKYRDPRTGEVYDMPEYILPHFEPSQIFRMDINQKGGEF